MKILVTGNMGYVGPGVVQQLRRSYPGASLVGFDMGYFATVMSGCRVMPECRVDVQHFGDVRRFSPALLEGVDAVVHLAAISNDPMGHRFEKVTLEINHQASVSLAEMAKAAGVSAFVLASSCSVYGAADDKPRTEESPVAPLTAYARSKVLAEQDLAGVAGPGFRVTCLRFATACGMSDRIRLDLVLNDFVASALTEKVIRIQSDGKPWRPLIHVGDMARAIDWAIARDESAGHFVVVNTGADEWNYQVFDLAAAVAGALPGTDIWVNPNAVPDRRSYRVSFARFRSLAPDHLPQYDLSSTVAGLADGLRGVRLDDGDFRQGPYVRLNLLSALLADRLVDDRLSWSAKA